MEHRTGHSAKPPVLISAFLKTIRQSSKPISHVWLSENRIDTSHTYILRGIQWHGTIIYAQQPDWSERAEWKDAGRACWRSPQISYHAGPGPGLSFEYIFIPAPLCTYYDYDAKLVTVINSGAARALVTGVKLAMEGPPGRSGPLPKM